jgi:O-antigen/teichoic acid export membrane protein
MIQRLIRQVRGSDFLRQNAVLFFGSLLVSVLNYAYYPVLGRLLKIEAYGEVQILISLFLQLTIFLTVLSQVTVNVTANYKDEDTKHKVVFELEKFGLLLSVLVLIVGIFASWQLKQILHFDSVWPFIVLLLGLVATVPLTFRIGYLRGKQRFGPVSVAGVIGAVSKLIISAGLVIIGFSTVGAIGGVLVAQLLAFVYTVSRARQAGFKRPAGSSYFTLPDLHTLKPELTYAAFVLVASLGVTILSSVDVFIVKHYFSAEVAGGYAGVATVAKMLFFLTASIAQVMLPAVKIHAAERANRQYLLKSLALTVGLGGVAMIVFMLLPQFVISVLMGGTYAPYAHLLPTLSLAMFLISVINLIVFYYVALRKYQIGLLVVTGLAITFWLLVNNHSSLDSIVNNLALGSVGMLALFAGWRVLNSVTKKEEIAV